MGGEGEGGGGTARAGRVWAVALASTRTVEWRTERRGERVGAGVGVRLGQMGCHCMWCSSKS